MDSKIDETKFLCKLLTDTAEEVATTIRDARREKDDYAIGFLQYVEATYTKQGDQYYFKLHNQHVHMDILRVMDNYKYFLKRHEEQGTQA